MGQKPKPYNKVGKGRYIRLVIVSLAPGSSLTLHWLRVPLPAAPPHARRARMAAPRGGRPSPSAALRHAPLGSSTAALHADARAGAGWDPVRDVAPPLSMTTTFVCAPEGGGGGEGRYCYSRMANPTRERAEALLAAVEAAPDQRGGEVQSVLYASGWTGKPLSASVFRLLRLPLGRNI